jgi:hypothetical protein
MSRMTDKVGPLVRFCLPGFYSPFVLALGICLLALTSPAFPAHIILNEYNAVDDAEYLNGGDADQDRHGGYASDSWFGRVPGNGGDWFELVVITDHLDIRRWKFDIWVDGYYRETLNLTNHPIWSDLRSGTIITISENVPDDVSYNPAYDPYDPNSGDWWINVRANTTSGTGTYIEGQSFPVNNSNWQLVIKTAANAVVFGPAGEGVHPRTGVSGIEICRLETDPNQAITPECIYYDDADDRSTFGAPNRYYFNSVQDFSSLRSVAPPAYAGGTGTPQDPYLIRTPHQLTTIGLYPDHWDKHFKLMANVDLSPFTGTTFNIIGDEVDPFTGVFDGAGHTISNFTYSSTGKDYIAIFGCVDDQDALIKDLGLIAPNVDAGTGAAVGSLIGLLEDGTVSNCYAYGGDVSGAEKVGGLVGYNCGPISNCYSTAAVSAATELGGLIGNHYAGAIVNSYAAAAVSGTTHVGGLVGFQTGGNYVKCFWDNTINPSLTGIGNATDTNVIAASTTQMQTADTYIDAGWDIISEGDKAIGGAWRLCSDMQDYPKLAWQFSSTDFVCPYGVDVYDLAAFLEQWLQQSASCADIAPDGGDGMVNMLDFAALAGNWLNGF